MLGGLPTRDLWLIPLISIITLLTMLAVAEIVAQFSWQEQGINNCRVPDRALRFRYRPNCSSTMKGAEGPWYTNDYNACGYRSAAPCGRVPAGTRRVALIGSSIGEGYLVEYSNTIGGRLEADLTAMCGAPVEVQNLAAIGYNGRRLVLRMEEALTLKPAAVLLVVLPFDIMDQDQEDPDQNPIIATEEGQPGDHGVGFTQSLFLLAKRSRALTMARSFLFVNNPSIYAPLYLHNGDKADFLRPPFTAAWRERLRRFDLLLAELADRAHVAGVPFMLSFVPNQAEVALAADTSALPMVDPEALPNAVAALAGRHGIGFVDSLKALRAIPKTGSLYYQVDGHPSGRGQSIVAHELARHYVTDQSGPFADCSSTIARIQGEMR
jgi:hypothetical protein